MHPSRLFRQIIIAEAFQYGINTERVANLLVKVAEEYMDRHGWLMRRRGNDDERSFSTQIEKRNIKRVRDVPVIEFWYEFVAVLESLGEMQCENELVCQCLARSFHSKISNSYVSRHIRETSGQAIVRLGLQHTKEILEPLLWPIQALLGHRKHDDYYDAYFVDTMRSVETIEAMYILDRESRSAQVRVFFLLLFLYFLIQKYSLSLSSLSTLYSTELTENNTHTHTHSGTCKYY